MTTLLCHTTGGPAAVRDGRWFDLSAFTWDDLVNRDDLPAALPGLIAAAPPRPAPGPGQWRAPIASQEVWAAGVTYLRSRTARMEESQAAGGGSFYDRVYQAQRPEIFFKTTAHRVVGPGGTLHLRSDSGWMVPEPELTLAVTRRGTIIGYTVGNDLSCRDLEGQNPLYLPQAKIFTGCAAFGPGLLISAEPLPATTEIALEVIRAEAPVFVGRTTLGQMKRTFAELVAYLFRDNSFPHGCLFMTGTGIVPPDDFTLRKGDEVRITVAPIGVLANRVE